MSQSRKPRLALAACAVVALATAGAAAEVEPLEWPREIVAPRGRLVIYQPQLETFDGNQLTARAAVSGTPAGQEEPVFGAVWFAAKVATDRDERTVRLLDVAVSDARFRSGGRSGGARSGGGRRR